jgi:tetratricopeptide (TPR) repeat protein
MAVQETFVDYYQLLNIQPTADASAIKAAISTKRRVWIKRQGSADPARRAEAEATVRHLREAEETLLNPQRRRQYDERLRTAPESATAAPGAESSDWMERAEAYLAQGNNTAAHRAACEATTVRGNDHRAWALRGQTSFLLGNGADAEFEYAEAIRLDPNVPDYHQDLGEVYGIQEKWPQAMREFTRVLQLDPRNPVAQTSIAQVYLNTDQAAKALEIMEGVVRENPGNEFFTFYLAAALEANAHAAMTHLTDGSFLATSEAQVQLLERTATRIAGLRINDPEVAQAIAELRRMAQAARDPMWVHSRNWQVYAIAVGALMCGTFGGLGSGSAGGIAASLLLFAPLTALIVYVYVQRHRKPTFAHAARQLAGQIVRRGA